MKTNPSLYPQTSRVVKTVYISLSSLNDLSICLPWMIYISICPEWSIYLPALNDLYVLKGLSALIYLIYLLYLSAWMDLSIYLNALSALIYLICLPWMVYLSALNDLSICLERSIYLPPTFGRAQTVAVRVAITATRAKSAAANSCVRASRLVYVCIALTPTGGTVESER